VVLEDLSGWEVFSTWPTFVVIPQKRHNGAFMTLDFSVYLGLKRKQEKHFAEYHGIKSPTLKRKPLGGKRLAYAFAYDQHRNH
jgi:hypothetical protein